jgi:hypothetical protein
MPDEQSAKRLVEKLRAGELAGDCEISVAAPNNTGAKFLA